MNPVIGKCPVCSQELVVSRLECAHCGTEISGSFALGRLYRLDVDETYFVETFIKNRGNAFKVGEELGMPYSAVRSRLTQIIRDLGYESSTEPKEEDNVSADRRQSILEDLAQGKITPDAAVKLLQSE